MMAHLQPGEPSGVSRRVIAGQPGGSRRSARLLAVCFGTLLLTAARVLAQVPDEAKINVVHPLPPQRPAWLDGYLVRWPVRVLGPFAAQTEAQTVLVRLPGGCWLKPDASDIAVQAGNGKLLPAAVLSHDPLGDTIVQFVRNGNDPWYWAYGVNAQPLPDPRDRAARAA